jgi:phosphotriesterase-related protein
VSNTIPTVLGSAPLDDLGRVLPHEHIASVHGRWGKQRDAPALAWETMVLDHYSPLLDQLHRDHDCRTIVEVSPSWGFRQARDLEVWAELSRRTGVNIVVSSGYYVGGVRPPDFAQRSVSALADLIVREAASGVAGTGVRAGIIKIAVGDFGADDRKLCRAAAIAQRETGLSITTHTCTPRVRTGVLDIMEGAGVPPERIYLGHADDNATLPELLSLVQRGCSVLLTIWGIQDPVRIGWRLPALPRYHSPGLVAGLIAEGHRDRVLMSIDYSGGIEEGELVPDLYQVEERTHLYMFTHVLDSLRKMGVSDDHIEHIMRVNPREMLRAAG